LQHEALGQIGMLMGHWCFMVLGVLEQHLVLVLSR
jgi:hypothetical protein